MGHNGSRNLRLGRLNEGWMVTWFLLYLGTVSLWMVGSFSLARAKGYHTDTMGGLFIFLFLLGFCFPVAPFLFPAVVIFGLKDKASERRRFH